MSTELFNLKGKVALITGSTHGLGMAMAMGIGNAGAKIIVNGNSSKEKLERAVKYYISKGLDAYGYLFDVSDDQSKILLSPFNDGELIMDFSELGPLVLYDYISKDTLSSGALNARFTYNSDKIIFKR